MASLKELREKLTAKQDALHKVFEEAKTDSGDLDFNQVQCLGAEVKGSIAVAEEVRAMNAELDDLGREVEALTQLEEAQQAEKARTDRMKQIDRRPPFPGKGDPVQSGNRAASDLAKAIREHPEYKMWTEKKSAGGVSIGLDDIWPSDVLAKAMHSDTIGAKALFQTTDGWPPESVRIPGFVEGVTRPIQLLDIIPVGQTGMELVKFMAETTRTHAAAETGEGLTFQESEFELIEQSSPVRKITDSLPVTDEQLEDVAQVESYINGRLAFGLRQRLDRQVLLGDGVGVNLTGILNTPGIQTRAKGADNVPDALFKAMRQVRVVGRAIPTHHVLHPEDWEKVRLLKTADGIYIWGAAAEAGPERIWGLPVVQQDANAAGTGLVGAFVSAWVSLFERRGVDIQMGFVGTQFVQGRRTVRADMRWAFVVFRPAAFTSVTGL